MQANHVTVASTLQDAIEGLFGSRLPLTGCSRTDAGVHALGFCAAFTTDRDIPCQRIIPALNVRLPKDVSVIGCREVPLCFHPRYDCAGKRYEYKLLNRRARDPFWEGRAALIPTLLDAELMHTAAQDFLGTHDFSAFCAAGGSVVDKTRTVTQASVTREGDLITFSVAANGFLYNMVRIMTGTLLDIAAGRIPADGVPSILRSMERRNAGQTAPAQGLYLAEVYYPPEAFALSRDSAAGGEADG